MSPAMVKPYEQMCSLKRDLPWPTGGWWAMSLTCRTWLPSLPELTETEETGVSVESRQVKRLL